MGDLVPAGALALRESAIDDGAEWLFACSGIYEIAQTEGTLLSGLPRLCVTFQVESATGNAQASALDAHASASTSEKTGRAWILVRGVLIA